jgi:hypothetical protein
MTNAVNIAQSGSNNQTFRNRIINGAMTFDQRNSGASVSTSSGSNIYTLDRWRALYSQTSKFTVQQDAGAVTPPVGFSDYLGVTSSSAYTVGASEAFRIAQYVEGFNFSDMMWGTANAQPVTLSFWVRSSLTGTFGGVLTNATSTRSYPYSYTISSANTWEYKTVTVPGDTTGTWVGATNGRGVELGFSLGSGSSVSTTANAWASGEFHAPTGAVSVVGTNGATFYITGVQLEEGTAASPFENRLYGTELALCQRYCTVLSREGNTTFGSGIAFNGTNVFDGTQSFFPTTMRAAPTLSASGSFSAVDGLGASITTTSMSANLQPFGYQLLFGVASGFTTGRFYSARSSSDGKLTFSAEL